MAEGGADKPDHLGHRQRLRERFLAGGAGGLAGVFGAGDEALREIDGIKDGGAAFIRAVQAAAERIARGEIEEQPVIGFWKKLIDYCRTAMAAERTEQFRLLFLDNKNALIADEVQQRGTVNHTPVYPREVVKRALELGASAIIMVHNHP